MKNEEMIALVENSQKNLLLILQNLDEISMGKIGREKDYAHLLTLNQIKSKVNYLYEALKLLQLDLE